MTLTYKFEWANGKGAGWFCTGPEPSNQKLYMYLHTNLGLQFTLTDVGNLYRFRSAGGTSVQGMGEILCQSAPLQHWKKAIVEGLIWASILAAVVKRYITHAAALATKSDC